MSKKSFKERVRKAREAAAERKANMTEEELEQLKVASRRHSKKVRDEIITSYELGQQRKAVLEEE